ncbi:SRPBCC family protein [Wenjunlia tyrosinilytica]|jgi:hypothetical protein|uniref:Polyketide cyclase n=1 Tax=Wenjunlia tyrosinilytica TaxID=1544741 RepID=A0A918DYC4_9ACTN|nr:SRPBCC family protein [Wenjunlia tyrosinilytica]GGO87894.1 polyketide cyclase [Wenjunlia tyrosinilytica]
MAARHVLVNRPPQAVWAVLSDGERYKEWVVGTKQSWEVEGHWPSEGSSIGWTVDAGITTLRGSTVVRICEPGRRLELEALAGQLGSARISFQIMPWGGGALVIVDEHPLSGPGAALHNLVLDALLQLRHRRMLDRLAEVVESSTPAPREREAAAA